MSACPELTSPLMTRAPPEAAELGLDAEPGGALVRYVDGDARLSRRRALTRTGVPCLARPAGAGGGESVTTPAGLPHANVAAGSLLPRVLAPGWVRGAG